jgi:hypothetical protein
VEETLVPWIPFVHLIPINRYLKIIEIGLSNSESNNHYWVKVEVKNIAREVCPPWWVETRPSAEPGENAHEWEKPNNGATQLISEGLTGGGEGEIFLSGYNTYWDPPLWLVKGREIQVRVRTKRTWSFFGGVKVEFTWTEDTRKCVIQMTPKATGGGEIKPACTWVV